MPTDDAMERAREIDLRQRYMSHAAGRQRIIAQALTEAHNAGMEEAAGIADKAARYWHEYADRHTLPMVRKRGDDFGELASAIRRAKSTEKV